MFNLREQIHNMILHITQELHAKVLRRMANCSSQTSALLELNLIFQGFRLVVHVVLSSSREVSLPRIRYLLDMRTDDPAADSF